jgi:hypothetical protein
MVTLTYREQAALRPVPWEATKENVERCRKALRGEAVPHDLLRYVEARRCVIYGIRHHLTFATSAEVTKLCGNPDNADFARARNARLIMSNQMPELRGEETYPYCIWFPEAASDKACRRLVKEYPTLRYNVGRACAVAGYVQLYRELGLLPDVSIAEEARDNGCTKIYNDIVGSAVRYAVMDDATRTIDLDNPRKGIYLNGESQVRSSVDADSRKSNESIESNFGCRAGYTPTFDITETGGITGDLSETDSIPLKPEEVKWLYAPLPPDLPTTNKDLLILMAAYEGNVDRYARLRRRNLIDKEFYCVIRGIYHSTTFARWWADELAANDALGDKGRREVKVNSAHFRQAISARYTMCNSLEWLSFSPGKSWLPYMIWYPLIPQQNTLKELVRRVPEMKQAVAHACIFADYQALYDSLDVEPHPALHAEAKNSSNRHYQEDLEQRAAAKDIDLSPHSRKLDGMGILQVETARRDKEPTSTCLNGKAGNWMFDVEEDGIYERFEANAKLVDLFLCSSERLREQAAKFEGGWQELYEIVYDEEGNEVRLGVEGGDTDTT